ncbi:hypothetical protein [Mycobacteroides abscessus]|uniref:hypothetical protein n=1 Tax=Mycobacteroides abscessus TaxID=36809 RepID=UPI0009A7EEEB|nr:hypothetical protein [Mycobacteroides abscessus]SKK38556.1 Uncharacterised protein [Mycobacteroides abscessus subsp. massiliense]SKM35974.1 Uncharacterised protein [Mycobacteroides abscessus subsp. massiliense]SKP10136.1 Uncharacterised protein [Mycobacteroides abscessus subsp. massiliense]SKP95508.1 Uncharacterised protein [Mycobacteroides abscessus subsp. massiliense]SLK59126.1 Uncharacterised protein [Mycobacteroides abscessus subsp. massiliense]
MNGRERIEQAAKENGWALAQLVDERSRVYVRGQYGVWVYYGPKGTATAALFGTHEVASTVTGQTNAPKDVAGQVIAYLQQHKDVN